MKSIEGLALRRVLLSSAVLAVAAACSESERKSGDAS